MHYERDNVRRMSGYSSGEQPDSARVIKLNTNENPYPPGPAVASALASLSVQDLRRYPPPTALPLRQSIAALHHLDSEHVIVTNGGDELLRLAFATFVDMEDSVAVPEPSYSLYEVLAHAHGCDYLALDLADDWFPTADFATQLNARGIKMAFVVNPHAPSGRLLSVERIRELARDFRGVLVLDEAYIDFVSPELDYDSISLVREFENLLILRTFSKGYSLAGLRMAYGLGAPSLISPMLYKTKDSYNTDFIAQRLAQAAIEDQAYAQQTWASVRLERTRVRQALSERGFSSPESQTNFLLATVPTGHSAEALYQGLKQRDILVRYFKRPRLDDKLRITIGTPEENDALLTALDLQLSSQ